MLGGRLHVKTFTSGPDMVAQTASDQRKHEVRRFDGM